jgi:hypothetical protein
VENWPSQTRTASRSQEGAVARGVA